MSTLLNRTNILLAGLALLTQLASADVTLCGSGSLGRPLTAKQADIEAKSGQKLVITLKNSVLGIKDLVAGTANLAMISGPFDGAAKAAGLASDVSAGLKPTQIGEEAAAFIVNPANPVGSLTVEQIKGIFEGKITNWKDVGGSDAAIKIFVLDGSNGPRLAADATLFAGAPLVAGAVERSKSGDITPIVAQVPDAISYVGVGDAKKAAVKIVDDKALTIPLILISKGEPTAEQKAVIDAAKEILSK